MTVLSIPLGTSEKNRYELEKEVFTTDDEEADYWVWAASDKTTWDLPDDQIGGEYNPLEMRSPMWTGDSWQEVADEVVRWYLNEFDVYDLRLWGHLGRRWMCFGKPTAEGHPFGEVNYIFCRILSGETRKENMRVDAFTWALVDFVKSIWNRIKAHL